MSSMVEGNSGLNDKTKIRNEFLLHMYDALWANISRAEDTAWKMMATYTALFAGLSLALSFITVAGFVAIITIFSVLAIAISLNANLWFVRNIGMISSIEQELLFDRDYGKILPKSFRGKPPFFSKSEVEVWWLLVPVFLSIPIVSFLIAFNSLHVLEQLILGKFIVISFALTAVYGWSLRARHRKFLKEVDLTNA